MSAIIAVKLFFKINIAHFWLFVTIVSLGYVLNKAIDEMVEKTILKHAFKDWTTFWKYYSNKIIWMDDKALNNEYQRLTEKYSELSD